MSPPDFATMERLALFAFRKSSQKRNEKPTVENNYFTTTPRKGGRPQPSDWIPTYIATKWCAYHGPSQHTPEECAIVAAGSWAEFQKQKAQEAKADMRRLIEWQNKVRIRPFCLSFNPIHY
jgi:hypothetical protein